MGFISRGIPWCLGVPALVLFAGVATAQRQPPPPSVNGADGAVFLKAAFPLDEPRHLCVDIPGHGARVNVARDLVVHTCKEGIWNLDERFEKAAIAKGDLRMPQYDLCVAARRIANGAGLFLANCGATAMTKWRYEEARLSVRGYPALCLTIGAEPSELTPGGRRLASRAVARSLALETCSEDAIERQLWTFADPLNITKPLMPVKVR